MPKDQPRKKSLETETRASVIPLAKPAKPNALRPLNFRVSPQFHREFKLYAVQRGISMVDLLQESFRLLKEQQRGQ